MQTSNGYEVDSKHDVVSVVASPLSKRGTYFVRDDKNHPFPIDHEVLLSPL